MSPDKTSDLYRILIFDNQELGVYRSPDNTSDLYRILISDHQELEVYVQVFRQHLGPVQDTDL